MIAQLNRWLQLRYQYDNPVDRQRALSLLYITALITAVGTIVMFVFALQLLLGLVRFDAAIAAILFVPVWGIFFYAILQRGYLRAAIYLIVAVAFFTTMFTALTDLDRLTSSNILVPLVIAGVLGNRSLILTTYAGIAVVAITAFFTQQSDTELSTTILITFLVNAGVIASFLSIFSTSLQRLSGTFVSQLEHIRNVGLSAVSSTGDANETELMSRTINIIRDQLPQTFAQIFLLDPQGRVMQRVYTGLGLETIKMESRIDESTPSAVSLAFNANETVQISLASPDGERQHFLPGVVAGVLVPLRDKNRVIAVLDVQTEDHRLLTDGTVETIELLATQLSTGLLQARVMRDLRESLQEQEAIINRQRARLRELEQSEQHVIEQAWIDYLADRSDQKIIGFDLEGLNRKLNISENVPPTLEYTLRTGDVRIEEDGEFQHVSIPIVLRGQALGALSFTLPANRPITARQIDMLQNVVQRLALALENKRLFERNQSQAQREAKANEIAGILLSTTDIYSILQLAAQNFNDSLGAIQTQIHLQPEKLADVPAPAGPSRTVLSEGRS